MSIAGKVAIVGVGCSKFGENWDQERRGHDRRRRLRGLRGRGHRGAAAPDRRRLRRLAVFAEGPGTRCTDALKLCKPVTMVSNYCATGTDAFRCGVLAVACGMYDTVLVVGFDKPKDRGVSGPSVKMSRRARPARRRRPAGSRCAPRRYFETLRRRARGPGAHRGEEPPQRHAGAEVVPEERDHASRRRSARA